MIAADSMGLNRRLWHQSGNVIDSIVKHEVLNAQRVALELNGHWLVRCRRMLGWKKLLQFLVFTITFCMMLALQRSAFRGHRVHSAVIQEIGHVEDVQNIADVYGYLQRLVSSVFVDPTCGDGVCESPFETAAWGRFGCASDCGFLQDELAFDAIQLDLEWDFSHHPSGLAASMLVAQARWNICPVAVLLHGHECYFEEDQKFQSVVGSSRLHIPALPAGEWTLVLKRDYFKKISAAVRNSRKVEEAGRAFKKIRMALDVAQAGLQYEGNLTREALEWAAMDLDSIVLQHINKTANSMLIEAEAQRQNSSRFSDETAYSNHLHDIIHNQDAVTHNYYNRNIAACQNDLERLNRLGVITIGPSGGFIIPERSAWSLNSTDANSLQSNITWPHNGQAQTCYETQCECSRLADVITGAVQDQLKQVLTMEPALFPFTTRLSSGQDAIADPMQSSITHLVDLYFRGSMAYSMGPLELATADASLDSHNLSLFAPSPLESISSMDAKISALAERSFARITEMTESWETTSNRAEVIKAMEEQPPDYDQVSRRGGSATYRSCNLEDRGLQKYQGNCQAAVPYTNNDTIVCETPVPDCERQVEMQQDCDALCECSHSLNTTHEYVPGCAGHAATAGQSTEFCTCLACSLLSSSRDDVEWTTISQMLMLSHLGTKDIYSDSQESRDMRGLQQLSTDSLRSSFSSFLSVQDSLQHHATSADSSIRRVRDAAKEPGKSSELEQLMSSSVSADHAKSMAHHKALAEIIDQQTGISDALERQNVAAATAQMLTEALAAAVQKVEKGYSDVLHALQRATAQEVVNEEALLVLWSAARRRLLVEDKSAIMASTPCTAVAGSVQQAEDLRFMIDHYTTPERRSQVRARTLGAFANHVLGGIHLHTKRALPARCSTKFTQLANTCQGEVSTMPFGIDPAFRTTAGELYRSHLDDEGTKLSLYNCSELPGQQSYGISYSHPHVGAQASNHEPYCAELYSQLNEPLAFQSRSLRGFDDGFSVWIDVQNTQSSASYLLKYVQGANLLDAMSQDLIAVLNSFNPILKVLTQSFVRFSWNTSGMIQPSFSIEILQSRFYSSTSDLICLAMEVFMFLTFAWGTVSSVRRTKMNGASELWPVLLNLGMTCILVFWWVHTAVHTHQLGMNTTYSVYTNLFSPANKLKSADAENTGLGMVAGSTMQLWNLASWRNGYFAMTGLYVIGLLVLLFVNRMQFHPVLGVVSRSLHLAVEDLENFLFLLACLVSMYAIIGHTVFGANIKRFSTAYLSFETCVHALLGDVSVGKEMRMMLDPIRTIGALYLWSYMTLVFTVALNFMLAIIVDAFIVHKSSGYRHQAGILEEVSVLTKDAVLHMAGKQYMSTAQLGHILQKCTTPEQSPLDCSFDSCSIHRQEIHTSNIFQALSRADSYRARSSQAAQHASHTLEGIAKFVGTSTKSSLRV